MSTNPLAQLGEQFVTAYYQAFAASKTSVISFYNDTAYMSFEGKEMQGKAAISQHLEGLPFEKIQHVPTTIDAQQIDQTGALICVTGQLKTDEDPPHGFSQSFVLRQFGPGVFQLTNDVFRLAIHNFAP
jgi:ketosteroid isomerase-like protein